MTNAPQLASLAGRLLRLEKQLRAYQKLHEDELAELWQSLNEFKEAIAGLCNEDSDDLAAKKEDPNTTLSEE